MLKTRYWYIPMPIDNSLIFHYIRALKPSVVTPCTPHKTLSAFELPDEWDKLTSSYFQTREFLHYAEEYNPCNQRYYTIYRDNKLKACAAVYTLTIDLLTFINVRSPVKMHVIGIPATVSPAGIFGEKSAVNELLKLIFKSEKGLIVGMNVSPELDCYPAVSMRTMPTIVMNHDFSNLKECNTSMRSAYKRRTRKFIDRFRGIQEKENDCSVFDSALYDLYLQIHKRSESKLEKLSLEFFKNLPSKYRLTTYSLNDKPIAWHITLQDNGVMYFFFGGTDYSTIPTFESYFNNIYGILRKAVEQGFKTIDFGQTAEIPKTRLGGKVVELNLFVYHRFIVINNS